ncbi:MAG: GNAT family N-acetyltransferase [Alphaproteobacteria bacterium]
MHAAVLDTSQAPAPKARIRRSATPIGSARPQSNAPSLALEVVSNMEHMMKVVTVRSLVYMADQECPFEEEFDGNDFVGMHVLASLGSEPVGTLRLRFFAGFAKLERVALRKEYRQSDIAKQMVQFALDICRRKGYTVVYGHAQVRLLRFWRSYGFHERANRKRFIFSDHEYAEIVCNLSEHPDAVTLESDPMVMIRPEGRWDEMGVLEFSAAREATNPNHA